MKYLRIKTEGVIENMSQPRKILAHRTMRTCQTPTKIKENRQNMVSERRGKANKTTLGDETNCEEDSTKNYLKIYHLKQTITVSRGKFKRQINLRSPGRRVIESFKKLEISTKPKINNTFISEIPLKNENIRFLESFRRVFVD